MEEHPQAVELPLESPWCQLRTPRPISVITLCHSPGSRSSRFIWLLEEIGQAGRAAYLVWLAFYAGEVHPVYITRWLYGDRLDPITLCDQARRRCEGSGRSRQGSLFAGSAVYGGGHSGVRPLRMGSRLGVGRSARPRVARAFEREASRAARGRQRQTHGRRQLMPPSWSEVQNHCREQSFAADHSSPFRPSSVDEHQRQSASDFSPRRQADAIPTQ